MICAGARDAPSIAGYINDVFKEVIGSRDRIHADDLPDEIFRVGTGHARTPRLPGEPGYEAAGIFTPDLRELDRYRYHDGSCHRSSVTPRAEPAASATRRARVSDVTTSRSTWGASTGWATAVSS